MPNSDSAAPADSAVTDAQIDTLFALTGIVAPPGDIDELRALARSMLQHASLIAMPLPFSVEPATVFSLLAAAKRR